MVRTIIHPLFWAFFAGLAGFAVYGYGHFRAFHNFEFYKGIEVASSLFGIVISLRLLFTVIPLEDEDLGKLRGQKISIFAGMIFVLFFAVISALTTLDIVYFENKTVLPTSPTPAQGG